MGSLAAVAVFCGSRTGTRPVYEETARAFARVCVDRGLALVTGGGSVGLMGAVADAALDAGGKVIGIMPQSLIDRELAHQGLSELHVVDTMHERKAAMAHRSQAAVALPGGAGTLDEWFESWTWGQLGIDPSPTGLLNVQGYFDHLLAQADRMAADGFMSQAHRDMLVVTRDPSDLLEALLAYQPPAPKWTR
ncbi:TIGR00730 family Rossman fold protein [Euzebya tangerina]|uniref:LOG family protein n=1 Tax=Euzebya tangerina TaxID=591198 RepID=UPI000E30DCEC|nr:TIGR00730 family Rossman fold protein [Euzebya tangerina]